MAQPDFTWWCNFIKFILTFATKSPPPVPGWSRSLQILIRIHQSIIVLSPLWTHCGDLQFSFLTVRFISGFIAAFSGSAANYSGESYYNFWTWNWLFNPHFMWPFYLWPVINEISCYFDADTNSVILIYMFVKRQKTSWYYITDLCIYDVLNSAIWWVLLTHGVTFQKSVLMIHYDPLRSLRVSSC